MALRQRDRTPSPTSPAAQRQRIAHAAVPTMQRTVMTTDPDGARVTLKAGTPTPDWFTGKSDGRALAEQQTVENAERVAAANHPAEQPVPEGAEMEAYLKGLEDEAATTGQAPPIQFHTAAAQEAVSRGLDAYAAEQELAELDPEDRAALEALSEDEQDRLKALDDDERAALVELAEVWDVPVWVNDDALVAIGDWLREHDVEPDQLRRSIELNDDGTVTVERYVTDAEGRTVIEDDQAVVEPVTIMPQRPFPVDLETGEVLATEPPAAPEGTTQGPDPLDPAEQALVEGSVDTVLARIGEDQGLAVRALAAEQAKGDKARTTLVDALTSRATTEPGQ